MLTRREFLKLCTTALATATLTDRLMPIMRQGFAASKLSKPPVIWLELGSCTGNSIALENAVNPNLNQVLTDMVDMRYNWLLNVVQGS